LIRYRRGGCSIDIPGPDNFPGDKFVGAHIDGGGAIRIPINDSIIAKIIGEKKERKGAVVSGIDAGRTGTQP
jgi:hypothetical protein